MKGNKALAIFMVIAMVFCYMPTTAVADSVPGAFKDMPKEGFWSTAALEAAVDNGLLNGFVEKDGTYIKPNDPLTRAQMAAIVNRAFGAETRATLTGVADVASNAWFAGDIQKAVQMGTMKLDTLMRPNDAITRQEAFTILARAFKMTDGTATDLAGFSDGSQVVSWALPGMGALVKAGYVQGSDNMLTPTAQMTRAQFAVIMNNMIQDYITQAGTVTSVANGNVMVNVPGVTLKDLTIQGDLIVGDGVGDGNITLENVTIKGDLIARGGGVNSIIIVGGGVDGKIVIAKVDGQIRVSVEGGAEVEVIVIDDGKDDVIIEGTVGTVEVTAPDTPIIVQNATVTNIEIKSEGAANVMVASNATVTNVVVGTGSTGTTLNVEGRVTNVETSAADTKVGGTGTVTTVTAKEGANNTAVTTPSTKVTNDGAAGVTAGGGTEVPSGSTATNSNTGGQATVQPTTGGTTGGGNGDTVVNLSAISVEPTELTLAVGDTETITATISPPNATNKNVAWESSDEAVAMVDANGEVAAVAAGKATITAAAGGYEATCEVEVYDTIYYVTTIGSDDNDGTQAAPFQNIQKAVNVAEDGDAIIVKEGAYNVWCPTTNPNNYTGRDHNLFIGKNITIKGEGIADIYSLQTVYQYAFDRFIVVLISGSDGVVLENLNIYPVYYPGDITTNLPSVVDSKINSIAGQSNLKVYYNQIVDALMNYNGGKSTSESTITNVTVRGCTIGDPDLAAEDWGSAIYFNGYVNNTQNGISGGYTVESNTFYGSLTHCENASWDANSEDIIIQDNRFYGNLHLVGERLTGWNLNSLSVFPTVIGNTFYKANASIIDSDGTSYDYFVGSRDINQEKLISRGQLEDIIENNFFKGDLDGKDIAIAIGAHTFSQPSDEYHAIIYVKKITPVVDIAVEATAVTAGQTLADSELSGTLKVSAEDGTAVAGTFEWDAPTTVVSETGEYGWRFIPVDRLNYNIVKGLVSVEVVHP